MFILIFFLTSLFVTERDDARSKALEQLKNSCNECLFKLLDCDSKGRVYESEFRRLFPLGGEHLPNELKPRGTYCLTAACEKKVIYVGKKYQEKYIFAVFIMDYQAGEK